MTTTTDQRDELAKVLKEAILLLSTIHNDEYKVCKLGAVRDGTIVSKEDLQNFEDDWQQRCNHPESMHKITEFVKEWGNDARSKRTLKSRTK